MIKRSTFTIWYLFLALFILGGCNDLSAANSEASTRAIFGTHDLSKARAVSVSSALELVGIEAVNSEITIETTNLVSEPFELETQAVLAEADGVLVYYRVNADGLYEIWLSDQSDDKKTRIYSGFSSVQSVAVDATGTWVGASIMNGSDNKFDIFLFHVPSAEVFNLTDTPHKDELDVSMTADGSKIVYSKPTNAGLSKINICEYSMLNNSCSIQVLGSTEHQRQASITNNGNYVSLVRDLNDGRNRVLLYDTNTNSYHIVITRSEELSHPSATSNGQQVMFLRNRRDPLSKKLIQIKNLTTNTLYTELSKPNLDHPQITANQQFFTYTDASPNGTRAFTRNIQTNQRASAQAGDWNYYQPYWQSSYQEEQVPPDATINTRVSVPVSMRSWPFNTERSLHLPPNFKIEVFARLNTPRFLAIADNGDLLVSQPGEGRILLFRPRASGTPQQFTFASNLRKPHDMVFHTINETTYLYVAESHQVSRYVYQLGMTSTSSSTKEVLVTGLPDDFLPELNGVYGHELKNIALDSNHNLYVSIASNCNACREDTLASPVRGAIYKYTATGQNGTLYAEGLRNAEGLSFLPNSNDLWVTVANRDNILYPFNHDFDGDGSNDYGKKIQAYIDDHPPELFTLVKENTNYGWPFCNSNPDTATGYKNMPLDIDVQVNPNETYFDCSKVEPASQGIQAHSTPLGLSFLQNTAFANPFRNGVAIAYKGSFNRSKKTGYRVAYFPWRNGEPTQEQNLVSGWLNEDTQVHWGRPVDLAVNQKGDMFISDDYGHVIYKLSYALEP